MRNAAVPNKDMFMKRDRKFVRYKEGAALYGIGITRFQQLAREAKVEQRDLQLRNLQQTTSTDLSTQSSLYSSNCGGSLKKVKSTEKDLPIVVGLFFCYKQTYRVILVLALL